jgi:hypothetical protein
MSIMQVNRLEWNGLLIWPPHWTEEIPNVVERGILQSVEILPLTDLIKINATYAGKILSGLMFSREEYQGSLYRKLKENIGMPLEEVGNIDVSF